MHAINNPSLIPPKCKRFLAIDPGLNGHTGFALWDYPYAGYLTPPEPRSLIPSTIGLAKRWRDAPWEQEAYLTASEVGAWSKSCTLAFIEMPELWGGSAISQASAAKGDLFKLTFLVGALYTILSRRGVSVTILSPRQWKGQLSKEMIDRRILHAINKKYPEHISDAVGIGLYAMGRI